jgi:hypothetical protein
LVLGSGPFRLEVSPALGGRVTRLVHQGEDLFTDASVNQVNHGSTYWPSPQSTWGWPPLAGLDSEAYEILSDSPLALRSAEVALGGSIVRLDKTLKLVHSGPEAFVVDRTYLLHNVGGQEIAIAGWEISRVLSGGLTFFPTGAAELTPIEPHGFLATDKEHGCTFYEHKGFEVGQSKKLNADGSGGFLAHLARTKSGPILLLKLFEDTLPEDQAEGEGEVEIFANEDGRYVEVEVQGALTRIAPGGASTFVVRWVTVSVPETVASDRAKLVAFAREVGKRWHPRGVT